MGETKFVTRLARIDELSERVKRFHLELVEPHRIEFGAGQSVKVETHEGIVGEYAIANASEMNHAIELVEDLEAESMGSGYFRELSEGAEVRVVGPVGEFKVKGKTGSSGIVFVCEGLGIVAVRSMLIELLEFKRDKRPIKLHWGLGYVEELFWEEELHQLDQEYDNFSMDIVLMHPPYPEWTLCEGRVGDCLLNHKSVDKSDRYYLSGNSGMIDGITDLLVTGGVGKKNIEAQLVER